jgi:hypothetical protein
MTSKQAADIGVHRPRVSAGLGRQRLPQATPKRHLGPLAHHQQGSDAHKRPAHWKQRGVWTNSELSRNAVSLNPSRSQLRSR